MSTAKKKSKAKVAARATQHITDLFAQADRKFSSQPALAHRYITLARAVAKRNRVPIPRLLKRRYCKKCGHCWKAAKNVRTRTHAGTITYTCLDCGAKRRFIYK